MYLMTVSIANTPSIIRIIKSRRIRWAGHVARMGEKRNAYRILVGKPEGKRPLGRHRRRWEDNIRLDLRETGWGGMGCIDLAQDRDQWRALVNTVMNLRVP
jgi:transcription termination factor 2